MVFRSAGGLDLFVHDVEHSPRHPRSSRTRGGGEEPGGLPSSSSLGGGCWAESLGMRKNPCKTS